MLNILFNEKSLGNSDEVIYETQSQISGRILVKDSYQGRELIIGNSTHSIKLKIPRANYWEFVVNFSALKDGDKVLILGLGGGEIVRRLLSKYNLKIDVVELDPKIIEIYRKYFQEESINSQNLKVLEGDAYEYVLKNKKKYNIIVGDVYFEGKYPADYEEDTFMRRVEKSLLPQGQFITNRIFTFRPKDRVSEYTSLLKHYFTNVSVNM